jgi:hypothetical protein
LRIKLLSTAVAAVAILAVGTASASAATVSANGSTIATNTSITASNSGSVVLGAGFGDVTCTSNTLVFKMDGDGTVDNGDATSTTYSGCSANVFGSAVAATVTAQNLGNADGTLTSSTLTVNDTDTVIVLGSGFGSCTIRVQGSVAGAWSNANSQGNLSAAPGLQVTSVSAGFLCSGISAGDPADFSGLYNVRTTTGNYALSVS